MRVLVLIGILLLGATVPQVGATIDACTTPARTSAIIPVAPVLEVNGALAYKDGSCTWPGMEGSGVVGGPYPNQMAACVAAGVHVVQSTYCGPMVAGHATVTCNWVPISGPVELFTVGFDLDGDGNLFNSADGIPETMPKIPKPKEITTIERLFGVKLWPSQGMGVWVVENPHDDPARVIALPTTTQDFQTVGRAFIGCA